MGWFCKNNVKDATDSGGIFASFPKYKSRAGTIPKLVFINHESGIRPCRPPVRGLGQTPESRRRRRGGQRRKRQHRRRRIQIQLPNQQRTVLRRAGRSQERRQGRREHRRQGPVQLRRSRWGHLHRHLHRRRERIPTPRGAHPPVNSPPVKYFVQQHSHIYKSSQLVADESGGSSHRRCGSGFSRVPRGCDTRATSAPLGVSNGGSSRATVPDGKLMVLLMLSIMSLTKMDLNLKANIFLDLGIQDGLLWTRNGLGFSK